MEIKKGCYSFRLSQPTKKEVTPYEAKRLPQEGIVLEVIENLHEIIGAKIGSGVKKFIKGFIENLLTEEVTAKIGAVRYERSSKRQGYRNGHYFRNLLTKFGPIGDIKVPRLDQGGMEFTVLNRYEHRRRDVDAPIGRLFLNGVSTRKLKGMEKPRKELLSFQLTEVEDTEAWRGFLADLKGRGLLGKSLKLIITDGNPGFLKALKTIYPLSRCSVVSPIKCATLR